MAEQTEIIWLDGIAKKPDEVEKICSCIHVRQNQWQPEWNKMYQGKHEYDYISDYECIFNHPMDHMGNLHFHAEDNQERLKKLQDAKKQGTSVKITELAHFTNLDAAAQILDDHGFRGGLKKINEGDKHNDVKANLSWWIPVFTDAEKNGVREQLGEVIKLFTEEKDKIGALKNQFATSDAFQPNPLRYGDCLFQYGINKLCYNYIHSKFIRGARELRYKILGTFGYKKEVMHAVLVCSETDGAGQFAGYPDVSTPEEDINNEAVITRDDDGNWYWRPQATGGGDILRLQAHLQNYPRYRRWEQVAFAFHIPNKKIMSCDSPRDHLKFIDQDRNIVDLTVDGDDSVDED